MDIILYYNHPKQKNVLKHPPIVFQGYASDDEPTLSIDGCSMYPMVYRSPNIPANKANKEFFQQLSCFPHDYKSKNLHILYSNSGICRRSGKSLEVLDIDFDQVISRIKKRFSKAKSINLICYDVIAWESDELPIVPPIDKYPEFQFYQHLTSKLNIPVQMFHYHVQPSDVDIDLKYADPYAYWFICHCSRFDIPQDYTCITNKLSCLNNTSRTHRSMITILTSDFDIVLTHREPLHAKQWRFIDSKIKQKYDTQLPFAVKQFAQNEYWKNALEPDKNKESFRLIQKAFCHIVTDDPYFDHRPRISDKTLKPFMSYRPFLLLGPTNTLRWLRDRGFCTFDKWWDESYDSIEDHNARLEAVYRIAEYINSLSLSDCKQIIKEMKPILEHNRNHLPAFSTMCVSNIQ